MGSALWALAHPEVVNAVEAATVFAATVRGMPFDPIDIYPADMTGPDVVLRERWAAYTAILREQWAAFALAVKTVRDAGEFLVRERPESPESPTASETPCNPPEGWLD
jgi:hypothetical protein